MTLSTIVALLSWYLVFLRFLYLCVFLSLCTTSTYVYTLHFFSLSFYTLRYDLTTSMFIQITLYHFICIYYFTISAYVHFVTYPISTSVFVLLHSLCFSFQFHTSSVLSTLLCLYILLHTYLLYLVLVFRSTLVLSFSIDLCFSIYTFFSCFTFSLSSSTCLDFYSPIFLCSSSF